MNETTENNLFPKAILVATVTIWVVAIINAVTLKLDMPFVAAVMFVAAILVSGIYIQRANVAPRSS